jgi:hypothetical protein
MKDVTQPNALAQEPSEVSNNYGYTLSGNVYLKGLSGEADRQIGIVKNTSAEALEYFVKRFDLVKAKVDKLCKDIDEAENKGSFLMKLIHMKDHLRGYDALGDFQPLLDKLNTYEQDILVLVGQNREKNTEIKQALLAELELVMTDIKDWKLVNDTVKEVREKYLKTGSVFKELEETIEGRFQEILDGYYTQRKSYIEERQAKFDERIAGYQVLIAKIEGMDREDINPIWALKQIAILKEDWKKVGPLPKPYFDPLIQAWKLHQKNIQRSYKKLKPGPPKRTAKEQQEYDNLKAKQLVIQEVYALASVDLKIAFGMTKELQQKWKAIGDVPDKYRNDVNAEFNYACDRIFEMSYLMRAIYVRYRLFHTKSQIEQFSVKIAVMKEIIESDEEDLAQAREAYAAIPNKEDRKNPDVKAAYNRVFTSERKLRVKHVLVSEMQQALDAL